jgi:hypothetical protein
LLAVDLVPDGSRPVATVTEPPTDMPTTTTMPLPTASQGVAPAQPPAPGSLPGLPDPIDYSPAELRVTVVPWGSIYIDGQLVVRETDVRQTFTLPPGPHTIAAEHPTLGRTEATIDLIPGSTRSVTLEL